MKQAQRGVQRCERLFTLGDLALSCLDLAS
jgi:hypothetical protein